MIEKIIERLEKEANNVITNIFTNEEDDHEGIENNAKADAYERAIEIVQEVAKEYDNGWIPVETELPKEHLWAGHVKSEDVFVTFLDNGGKARVDTDNTYDGKWHYYGDRVIAWMPKKLPTPYQKGE